MTVITIIIVKINNKIEIQIQPTEITIPNLTDQIEHQVGILSTWGHNNKAKAKQKNLQTLQLEWQDFLDLMILWHW